MSSRVSNTINKYLLPTDRVLDVGCGIGNIAVGLKCAHITGIDIVDDYLIQFKNRVPEAEVLKIDISNFDYRRFDNEIKTVRKFDVVLCIDLIEHLEPGIDKRFLKYMESTAERLIVVFSPEHAEDPNKIVVNTPHNIWGTNAGDKFQVHKSAQNRQWYIDNGYKPIQMMTATNVYDGSKYHEMLYIKEK